MKTVDIMGAFVETIENQIFDAWKHEGFIGGWTSEHINFEVDGKEYVVNIQEITNHSHWSQSGTEDMIRRRKDEV